MHIDFRMTCTERSLNKPLELWHFLHFLCLLDILSKHGNIQIMYSMGTQKRELRTFSVSCHWVFFKAILRYKTHTIKVTHLPRTVHCLCVHSCSHHCHQVECFCHPERKPLPVAPSLRQPPVYYLVSQWSCLL